MYSSGCIYCGGHKEVLFSYEYLCRCGGKPPSPPPLTEEDIKRIIKENK